MLCNTSLKFYCAECKCLEVWNLVKTLAQYGLMSNSPLEFLKVKAIFYSWLKQLKKNSVLAGLCTYMKGRLGDKAVFIDSL